MQPASLRKGTCQQQQQQHQLSGREDAEQQQLTSLFTGLSCIDASTVSARQQAECWKDTNMQQHQRQPQQQQHWERSGYEDEQQQHTSLSVHSSGIDTTNVSNMQQASLCKATCQQQQQQHQLTGREDAEQQQLTSLSIGLSCIDACTVSTTQQAEFWKDTNMQQHQSQQQQQQHWEGSGYEDKQQQHISHTGHSSGIDMNNLSDMQPASLRKGTCQQQQQQHQLSSREDAEQQQFTSLFTGLSCIDASTVSARQQAECWKDTTCSSISVNHNSNSIGNGLVRGRTTAAYQPLSSFIRYRYD